MCGCEDWRDLRYMEIVVERRKGKAKEKE